MPGSEQDSEKKDDAGGNSLLLTITGPFLNFLALHNERKLENQDKLDSLKSTFWPFAVAGGFLFGLGIAGGNAFMSGKIDQAAMQAAEESNPRDVRRGLRRILAGEKTPPSKQGVQVAGDKPLVEKISPEARRAAVRTASAALGLGTLLACTGAVVCVKLTSWYLDVHTAEEFADHMRKRLPSGMAKFSQGMQLNERKSSLATWFRDSLGVGEWIQKQELDRRARAEKAAQEQLEKSGALTAAEIEAEKTRVAESKLAEAGPVGRARTIVRRTTGL